MDDSEIFLRTKLEERKRNGFGCTDEVGVGVVRWEVERKKEAFTVAHAEGAKKGSTKLYGYWSKAKYDSLS